VTEHVKTTAIRPAEGWYWKRGGTEKRKNLVAERGAKFLVAGNGNGETGDWNC